MKIISKAWSFIKWTSIGLLVAVFAFARMNHVDNMKDPEYAAAHEATQQQNKVNRIAADMESDAYAAAEEAKFSLKAVTKCKITKDHGDCFEAKFSNTLYRTLLQNGYDEYGVISFNAAIAKAYI